MLQSKMTQLMKNQENMTRDQLQDDKDFKVATINMFKIMNREGKKNEKT